MIHTKNVSSKVYEVVTDVLVRVKHQIIVEGNQDESDAFQCACREIHASIDDVVITTPVNATLLKVRT